MRFDNPDGTWQTRVIQNMYPVLANDPRKPLYAHNGMMHTVEGIGTHNVIIETPRHDHGLALVTEEHMATVVRTYRDCYNACRRDPRIEHIVLFKNHGAGAGTSIEHPHAQIVGTPIISYQVRERVRALDEHLAIYGECVLCRMIKDEIEQGTRVINLSKSFVAIVPFAALSRYHIWVFPRRHMAHFGDVSDEELPELASVLRTVFRQLYYGLGDPDYNFLIRSAPRNCPNEGFHWYVSIVPRIGQAAGFEFGSGIFVNTSCPEDSAAFLRSIDLGQGI